jgi:putative ABC transport system permease protein
MERLFLDMSAERVGQGQRLGPGFWLRLGWDTGSQAVSERLAPSRPVPPSTAKQSLGDRMSTLIGDIRYAIRTVVRQPSYGLMIVMMMALGIAGNAAVFRIFNGLFLRPLPFEDAGQLVDLDETAPRWDLEFVGISYPDFAAWRRENGTFSGMAVYTTRGANFAGDADAERIQVVRATYDLASVLGFDAMLGRFFSEEEDVPDGPRVALLSRSAVVWVPLQEDEDDRGSWYLKGVGRLKPGVSLEQARADLLNVHRGMAEEHPVNEITSPVVNSVRDRYLGEFRLGSSVLLGAVGIVLLIACANIAGLMLARSLARSREIGIRIAMGAGRGRIVRQLLTESLLLASVGAAVGTGLGLWGSTALVTKMTEQFPSWVAFALDWRFVVFTLLVTVGAAVVFGLMPALQAAGVDTRGVLETSSTRTSGSLGKRRSMNVLVAGEVALALALLIVGGLSVRDLQKLQQIDPGFRTENVLSYRLALPSAKYENEEQQLMFFDQHLEHVRSLPGVTSAAGANALPLSGHWGWFFQAEGAPPRRPEDPNPVVLTRVVTPGYFATMGVTLKTGRVFNEFDGRDEGSRAVIVNETFANHFFPSDADPVGKRIRPGIGGEAPWITVVGVSRDVKHYGVDEEMRPGVYLPLRQMPDSRLQMAVRTSGDPVNMVSSLRAVVSEVDSELPVYALETMQDILDESLWTRRASSWLIAAFSTVALVLAVAGLYGVISYSVGQRAHEISIRIALGAANAQVLRHVMRQGMVLVSVGTVLGLGATYAASRVLANLWVGVSATDPAIYAAVTILLLGIAALANFIPARRAAGLEPMQALRGE